MKKSGAAGFFYHLLVMDGQEVGAVLMCDFN
jgi:hypothetical protein